MNRLFRFLKRTLITIIVLYLALFGFTKAIRYPEPIAAIKLGLAPASKTPDMMPAHQIAPAAKPIAIPTGSEKMPEMVQYQKRAISFDEFLTTTKTNAFLVIRNGVLTYDGTKTVSAQRADSLHIQSLRQ